MFGCTDSIALNYNYLATFDDSSCCYNSNQILNQIGQDINGQSSDNFCGGAVAISATGLVIATGSDHNDNSNGTQSGHVRIYENISGIWTQIGQDIIGESPYDYSGTSVSLSYHGETVAIGAGYNDENGLNSGHVRVYRRILDPALGTYTWTQQGQDINGEGSSDYSGCSVSIDAQGNTVAIGANKNNGNGSNSGHVRVYGNISGIWTQIGQDIDGEAAGDDSGFSVSINSSGSIVAIGAPYNNDNGSNSGHVRVYENISGIWTQIGQDIDGEAISDFSGRAISLSSDGTTVAIGADGNDGTSSNTGHVRVYENISGIWTQIGQDIDGESSGDQSGFSVSINSNGSIVAIGALYNDGNGNGSGHVRVYENLSGIWTQIGQDVDGGFANSSSGYDVALSSNSNMQSNWPKLELIIGSPNSDNNGNNSGHISMYSYSSGCADLGCLDPLALNFDPYASVDDSTCIYPIYGCLDPLALNYSSLATIDDGSCISLIYGCTDSLALNYDTTANINDQSCIYCQYGCTDSLAINYDSLATCDDGSCIPVIYGCTDSMATNYYPGANIDDGSCVYSGCTDPSAINYNPYALFDDGSCLYYSCQEPAPINLFTSDITDNRATVNWGNMNSNTCVVLKYNIRYREVGSNSWITKSGGVGNGLCNFGVNTTLKLLQNLTPGTNYQYKIKAFYCFGGASTWTLPQYFTTDDICPEMTNLTIQTYPLNTGKATFSWDSTGAYVFARIALRVNDTSSSWQTAGGFGVYYPTLSVNKFGLQSGTNYRAQGRTFCDSNITSYRSWWTSPVFWTQPVTIRLNGGVLINDLDIYPNPSRDIFNISFNSEEIQSIRIRILNILGEVVYKEDLIQYIGEYTKQIDLSNFEKSIYFVEIETKSGIINKKLVLQ